MQAKNFRRILSLVLALALLGTILVTPVSAFTGKATAKETLSDPIVTNGVNSGIVIDEDPAGGYAGDYVVIYNPSVDYATAYSTGTMTGLIETTVNANYKPTRKTADDEMWMSSGKGATSYRSTAR